jgi:TM2 domain-containing membrane protein YozV
LNGYDNNGGGGLCPQCGAQLEANARFCGGCGFDTYASQGGGAYGGSAGMGAQFGANPGGGMYGNSAPQYGQNPGGNYGGYQQPSTQKSKLAAGLLGIFLGHLGIHNFYLGFKGKAITQLVLSIVGYATSWLLIGFVFLAISGIWGLVEGIRILTGGIAHDANGIPLRD